MHTFAKLLTVQGHTQGDNTQNEAGSMTLRDLYFDLCLQQILNLVVCAYLCWAAQITSSGVHREGEDTQGNVDDDCVDVG